MGQVFSSLGPSTRSFSVLGLVGYFAQLFFHFPIVWIAARPLTSLMSVVGPKVDFPSHIHFAGYDALVHLFVGLVVGWAAGRIAPGLVSTGRWIWIPFMALSPDILSSLLRHQAVPWLNEYLFQTAAEGAFTVALFTLPGCSAIGYSIGMVITGFTSRDSVGQSARHLLIFALAWFGLFLSVAPLLHRYEQISIQKWSKVRYVVDRPGLWVSRDANRLCTSSESGDFFVANDTMVQSLETRNCGTDRLLEAGAPAQPQSWTLERVKVLDGPHAGAEGWARTYGLLETIR